MSARIAHVISTRRDGAGAEKLLAAIAREGDERGWEQLVLNPFIEEDNPALVPLVDPVPYEGRPCRRLRDLPSLRSWVQGQLNHFKPDIIHALLFHATVTVASLPRRRNTKRVLTHVYGEAFRVSSSPPRVRERLDRWAGRRFDRVVAISSAGQRFLINEYGYSPSMVSCILPGWEGEPLPRENNNGTPTVICIAKMRPEKGHDILLSAFQLVRQQMSSARLVLIGDGLLRDGLEKEAAALGLGDSVEFAGTVPDIWPHLAKADVFALASRTEAFGIAVVEAMAAGLPVVAAAVGGIPELVSPGVTGELFPPGDHRALAEHLLRLLREPEIRGRMGAAAQQAAEGYRLKETVRKYCALYADLLRRPEMAQP